MKGNVVDLAVAVVIGGAFKSIIASLVDDIIMPIIGMITGGHDLTMLRVTFGNATIKYGFFLQSIINFLIIAMALFLAIKLVNKFKKQEEKTEEESAPTETELLTEIRDLLKKKK